MKELSDDRIESIKKLLEKGKPLPNHYKEFIVSQLEKTKNSLLFDTKKEYELIYADNEREEDILADTMAVPLQKVKTFRNGDGTVPEQEMEDVIHKLRAFAKEKLLIKNILQRL